MVALTKSPHCVWISGKTCILWTSKQTVIKPTFCGQVKILNYVDRYTLFGGWVRSVAGRLLIFRFLRVAAKVRDFHAKLGEALYFKEMLISLFLLNLSHILTFSKLSMVF